MSTDTLVFSNDSRFKKQLESFCHKGTVAKDVSSVVSEVLSAVQKKGDGAVLAYTKPVSYTHLTLPTMDSV